MNTLLYITIALYALTFILALTARGEAGKRRVTLSTGAALLSLSAALAVRTLESGHAPMASVYETLLFFSWSIALITLITLVRYRESRSAIITLPLAATALCFALKNISPSKELTLILRTRWFETHVIASFAAYAFFTLAFAAGLLYLYFELKKNTEEQKNIYQEIAARTVMWGFFFFSLSMFAGAIWGYLAWGTYWMWEPKIIWSFIVWFYYAGTMHAFFVRRWRGRPLAIATVVGFFVVLFTYLGVGLLMKSSHSF